MWNEAVQCSHCGLVTVAMTKTIMTLIQWATCRCCMSNSWTWFLDKIQKMEMNEKLRKRRKRWNTETLANLKKLIQTCVHRNVQLAEWKPIKGKTNANLNSNKCDIAHPTTAWSCAWPKYCWLSKTKEPNFKKHKIIK